MLSRNRVPILCCALLLFNSIAVAQSSEDKAIRSISLVDAVSRTMAHSPELAVFDYQLDMQRADTEQAGLGPSPEFNLSIEDAAGSGSYQGSDNAQATLGIAWIIEGDIRQGRVDVAQAATQSVRLQKDVKRLDLAADTARLYASCLARQARMALAEQSLSLAEDTVSALRKRLRAGGTAAAELARAQAEEARRKLLVEDMEHELVSAYRLLAAQWGDTEVDFDRLSGDIFSLPRALPYHAFAARLEQNPAIMALFSERSIRQAELKLQQAQSSAPWKLNLGVRHYEAVGEQALVAGISIPFGERSRNQYAIARAQAALSQLSAQEQALRVRYQSSLFVSYQEYQHSLHRIDTYKTAIIPRLEKALKDTRRAYNIGRYSYLEWQSVQSELLAAQLALLEASVDAHLKIIEIERLSGVPVAPSTTGS
jgi:cobalt-zinc-cadmium efflux system outer membrane protein